MKRNTEYRDYILYDVLGGMSGITSRGMFGGFGLYKEGIFFGIITNNTLYFKVDEENKPLYEEYGSTPFQYEKKGETVALSYWEVPLAILESPQDIENWVNEACEAQKRKKSR